MRFLRSPCAIASAYGRVLLQLGDLDAVLSIESNMSLLIGVSKKSRAENRDSASSAKVLQVMCIILYLCLRNILLLTDFVKRVSQIQIHPDSKQIITIEVYYS